MAGRRLPLLVAALATTTGWGSGLGAQGFQLAGSALGLVVRVRSEVPGGGDRVSGVVGGAAGTMSLGRWRVEFEYWQGALRPDVAGALRRDAVEGRALFGVYPVGWFALKAGPHVRSYTIGAVTQRWALWEARARAEGALVAPAVRGYVELWRALSADVNVPEPFDHAQGGEVGMGLQPARGRVRARIAYRIEHAAFGGGTRIETVEQFVLGLGLKLR